MPLTNYSIDASFVLTLHKKAIIETVKRELAAKDIAIIDTIRISSDEVKFVISSLHRKTVQDKILSRFVEPTKMEMRILSDLEALLFLPDGKTNLALVEILSYVTESDRSNPALFDELVLDRMEMIEAGKAGGLKASAIVKMLVDDLRAAEDAYEDED